ncbi:MAG TPA: glycosyltransferase, partial [Verrucomicrobiae bacterium]|nr:glycosyltransferase [Verrucomicrobiae bacterium]
DRATKIVFELDDALTLLPPTHEAFRYFQSAYPQIAEYLQKADLVTVSTPKLKELFSWWNERIEVLPNTIDTSVWMPLVEKTRPRHKISILFSGTLTHGHDLAVIAFALHQIAQEFGDRVEFVFWGDTPSQLAKLPQVRTLAGFTPDYFGYAHRMKRLPVDFAIVPLETTPFNRAKSPVKWLEYSACGIPAIFSSIEAYSGAVEHGKTGWLVPNTSEAWYEAIKKFVLEPDLRRTIGEAAHRQVLSQHTLAQNTHLWLHAYERLLASPKPAKETAPQVSIVIPVFNNLDLTRQCLDSIFSNTPQGLYEIIVVDNASTDGTRGFLQQQAEGQRLRGIFNSQNRGFAAACNQGAQEARCPQVLFLNNDTVVLSGWLQALLEAGKRPGTGVVGAKLLYANGRIQHAGIEFINGVPDHPYRHAEANLPEANQARELDMVTGACLLIRRELFLELAGFDEVYRNGVEDVDLCLRVRAAGWKVVYEPRAVAYHLEGQSAGRFAHVKENLTIFFERWRRRFDAHMRLAVSSKPELIQSSSSLLRPASKPKNAVNCRIGWEGSFLDSGSLSHVNRELTRQLSQIKGISLSRVASCAAPAGPLPVEFSQLAESLALKCPTNVELVVRHAWPPDWRKPASGKLVVIQPWEYGALPKDWVRSSKDVDEFWVPSEYVRKVFVDSGIPRTKVHVVPNGIDPERFHPEAAPLGLPTRKSFKFLFVGGTIHRKGADVLLHTYLKTFSAEDDVCLVIKDFGNQSVYAGQTLESAIQEAQRTPGSPEIVYLNQELPEADLPRLYAACDCLVHPYRGEGFGLPVLEAMACAKPVIVTAGGAADDFAKP